MQTLFDAVRQACSPHVWSRGVEFTRANAVLSERADGEEVVAQVLSQDDVELLGFAGDSLFGHEDADPARVRRLLAVVELHRFPSR